MAERRYQAKTIMEEFSYMLAPIEDMTDSCFRTMCHKYGADLTFTELMRFQSLAKNNKPSWDRIKLDDDTPTVIQLIGSREQFLKKFLKMFNPEKGFKGFNLNLGCPAPNFVNQGVGCAMIKRITKTKKLADIIKDHSFEVSIKMRLGLNQYEKEKKVYLNLIDAVDAAFFIIHARSGNQTYKDKADWSVFPECAKTGKNIIANGDIKTKEDVELMRSYGCKGVMIGRPAIADPLIFAKLKGMEVPSTEEWKIEYQKLVDERNPSYKYEKNVLKHALG
ncbi:MAG: tRNA-dihydrouridine synthase family protein [Nanoarchaeota archaeon]|nr:tRNA-dihydrouridine synthase family protein [Nanoarchaeota archaeon]